MDNRIDNVKPTFDSIEKEISDLIKNEYISDVLAVKDTVEEFGIPIIKGICFVVKMSEDIRLKMFLRGIISKKFKEKEFIRKIEKFADKELLGNIIKKQINSNHKYCNLICGTIINKALKNEFITDEEINHIEFLLDLNLNDLKNYIWICEQLLDSHEEIIKKEKIEHLKFIQVTVQKMKSYGYCNMYSHASISGDIHKNEYTLAIYEEYIREYFDFLREYLNKI